LNGDFLRAGSRRRNRDARIDDAWMRLQGLNGVAHQIQDHLLDLDGVGDDGRQIRGQPRFQADVAPLAVRLHQLERVRDQMVEIECPRLDVVLAHQGTQALDHIAGARRLQDDLVQQSSMCNGMLMCDFCLTP
jgi:hypothetical protein